jgi:two-component system chemotaxis sensor kinase CheA
VDVGLLDGLMTLVGELVLARNQILQRTTAQQDPVLSNTAQRLDAITTELQEGIMRTRMQPIGTLWVKYPRLVRDLALECGKQVRIRTEGEDTELDRSLIEAVRDPLTHLVRNSIDHGIEPPADRKKAG